MLKTKTRKVVSIIMLVMMLMVTMSNVLYASDLGNIANGIKGNTSTTTGAGASVKKAGDTIVGFIQVVGVVVAVIILVVIGVKYITASPEQKAEYKTTIIPYVVGAILIAAAPFIAGAIFNFAGSLA